VIGATLPPPLRRAVSRYTGIVRTVEECLHETSDPPIFRVSCAVGCDERLLGVSLDHLEGIGGAGMTRGEAAASAVGEALERYSASFVPEDALVIASAVELGDAAVAPERFALFSQRQHAAAGFPFRRFTRDARVAWVAGWSLPGGEPAWLPAELVFLGAAAIEGDQPIGYATSSGTACGETRDATVIRGLCELLERDAFMIVWTNRLSLPLLDWSADARIAGLDRRFFAPTGLAYAAIDLSCFHQVPSVLGVVRARGRCVGALGVGAGTGQTIERAWWKALAEAFAARAAGAKLALLGSDGDRIVSFEDHIRFYADERHAERAAFVDASAERTPTGRVASLVGDQIEELCARVASAGSSAYAVDVTSPDVAELGLTVTKVVAPELCALDVAHRARFLGGPRLYAAAAAAGLRDDLLAEADVNPDPHPFP
jgi:ribosomal protein S12 methylthiotransferase accessory factor